jgi:hypothetical protein
MVIYFESFTRSRAKFAAISITESSGVWVLLSLLSFKGEYLCMSSCLASFRC